MSKSWFKEIVVYCPTCKTRSKMYDTDIRGNFIKDKQGNKLLRCSKCLKTIKNR